MKRVLSLFLLLALALSLFSCGGDKNFNYVTSDMKNYVRLSLSDFTGGTYTLTDNYGTYDDERVMRQFRDDRLTYAGALGQRNEGAPAYGDGAQIYYEVALTQDGEGVFSNLYTGEGTLYIMLGYWEFLEQFPRDEYHPVFYNQTLSEFLEGREVVPHITEGVVKEGDKVRVSYTRFNEKGIAVGTATNLRIDTGSLSLYPEEEYAPFLLSSLVGKTIGKKYTVEGMEKVKAEDGTVTEQKFSYEVTPSYVVEEEFATVAVTLPADTFTAEEGEAYQILNGKTVYFRILLEGFYAYNTPALTPSFLLTTYGIVTSETEEDKILADAIPKYIAKMEEERLADLKEQALVAVMSKLYDEDHIRKYPEKEYNAYYNDLYERCVKLLKDAKDYADENGYEFPEMTLEEYLVAAGIYDETEHKDMAAYLSYETKQELHARLLLFAIAQVAEVRYTEKEYRAFFEAELEKSLAEENANGLDTTREDLIAAAGGEEAAYFVTLWAYTEEAVTEYIYKNNTWKTEPAS